MKIKLAEDGLVHKIKKLAIYAALSATISLVATAISVRTDNIVKKRNIYPVEISKVDGIASFTQFQKYIGGKSQVTRDSFYKAEIYSDNDGDGLVDEIIRISLLDELLGGHNIPTSYRSIDHAQNPDVFKKADKVYQKQMKRFEPQINEAIEYHQKQIERHHKALKFPDYQTPDKPIDSSGIQKI